jgi:nucleoside-diphosphate-sugar epimerase
MKDVLQQDIREILSDKNIPWHELKGGNLLVTGATGLVGGALVRALSAAGNEYGLNLRIFAHGRDKNKGAAIAAECGAEFISGDIRESIPSKMLPGNMDYIIHCAAVTKSAVMAERPADVITTEAEGVKNSLEAASERHCKSFVYISSMEVYGSTELSEVSEKDLGYLDLYSARSCYPAGKRFSEALCSAYCVQYSVPAKTARLAQTFGAGTPYDDTRVFAQFARNAMAGKDIELHTEGKSRGNYCYLSDTVRGLLTVLLKGGNGEAYNVANPEASVTIREMAEMLAERVFDGGVRVVSAIPNDAAKRGYAPYTGFKLNADKLKALGWTPKHGLEEMYRRMIAYWREHLKE